MSRKSVRNLVVLPSCSKGTFVQCPIFNQPFFPSFSTAVFNSTYPLFPFCTSAFMRRTGRNEENPSGRNALNLSCSTSYATINCSTINFSTSANFRFIVNQMLSASGDYRMWQSTFLSVLSCISRRQDYRAIRPSRKKQFRLFQGYP